MREYFATLKQNASTWGSAVAAYAHISHIRLIWIIGLGAIVLLTAVIAWRYDNLPLLTSAQPQSSHASLSINTLPAAPLPALSASAEAAANSDSSSGNSPRTQVTVNNQAVSVPSNGTVKKQIKSNGSTTRIDISSSTNTSGSSSSDSSLTVNVDSQSDSESSSGNGP